MKRHRVLMVPSWQLLPVDRLSPDDTEIVCRAALELWENRLFDTLLLCGGRFLPRSVQTRPSSDLMREWFIARGVPENAILCERESLDTYDNLRYGLGVLRQNGIMMPDILVCTQWQHAIRIWMTFNRAHQVDVALWPLTFSLSRVQTLWQWFCVFYHWIDRDGSGFLARWMRARRRRATRI